MPAENSNRSSALRFDVPMPWSPQLPYPRPPDKGKMGKYPPYPKHEVSRVLVRHFRIFPALFEIPAPPSALLSLVQPVRLARPARPARHRLRPAQEQEEEDHPSDPGFPHP